MGYILGIDLGTTWTAAAILRDGRASMVELSQRSTAVPSVVLLREDSILVGQAAERRAVAEPGRVAREFKRRMGDSTPLLLGGAPYSAEAVTARLLAWVVEEVSTQEGGQPDELVLTHPANWGDYKLDLLRQAVTLAGLKMPARLISEPEAAAIHYASKERVEPGTIIGAYDLGGGTFDAAVLRKTIDGFEFLGQPAGIERLGGIDFDEAMFQRVITTVGIDLSEFDADDQSVENALRRLRSDCIVAKEVLSTDTDTSIPVMLPSVQTEVRLTRAEFESMIRPTLGDTITVTERAFDSAGIETDAIDRILLIGGSSRIPVVAELLATRFRRPLAIDAHPKNAVALGAALSANDQQTTAEPEPVADTSAPSSVTSESIVVPPVASASTVLAEAAAAPPVASAPPGAVEPPLAAAASAISATSAMPAVSDKPPVVQATAPAAPPPPRSKLPLVVGGLVVAIAAIIGLVFALGGDDVEPAQAVAVDVDAATRDTANQGVLVAPTEPAAPTVAPTVVPTEVPTVVPTPTAPPTEVPVVADGFYEGVRCENVQELCIDITEVELVDGELLISWAASFVPNVNDRNHAHFFWSIYSPLQAGAGGSGDWEISDAQPHLAGTYGDAITRARRPSGADICVTVANPDHTVRDAAIYQCWRYPDPAA